jgi:hypothetical protein
VRIEWPASGQVQTFEGVRRNTTLEVIEPTAGVVPDREGPLPVVSNPARKKLTTKGTRNRPRIVSDRSS